MTARIYQPTKTAMQSGRAQTRHWCLEFEAAEARHLDPLMGWSGSGDTDKQVVMRFDSKQHAIAFAEKHGIDYHVQEPHKPKRRLKAYADNFAYNRMR